MKEELMTDALVREFLLGKLADEHRERIEGLFLTDPQSRERVLAIEQDLIEDYLEDVLTEDEKERFLARYAQTSEQRRKLRITKSIKYWALDKARTPQVATATVSAWSRFWTWLRLEPTFVVPTLVAIVIVLALVLLNSYMERRKHLAGEQELAQLNSPAGRRETPPDVSYELSPVTVRSAEQQAGINTRSETRIVEMSLPWIQKGRYATYEAKVRRTDDNESFSIRNLQPENDGEYKIRVRLPTHMLRRGSYQIQLRGLGNDGSMSPAEEYTFTVSE